jgi:hypothetical protein
MGLTFVNCRGGESDMYLLSNREACGNYVVVLMAPSSGDN